MQKKYFYLLIVFVFTFKSLVFSYPTQTIKIPSLKNKAEVNIDKFGIPHIKAKNFYDLFFAQGYITAKDRLFQMDFYRRSAKGEMAEILGKGKINDDYQMRMVGFVYQAEEIYKLLPTDIKKILIAYSDGVNYYIKTHKNNLPEEFKKLNYIPKNWTPVDSIVFGRVMSWRLSSSLEEEVGIALLVKDLGFTATNMVKDILTIFPTDDITIMKTAELVSKLPKDFSEKMTSFKQNLHNLNEKFAFVSKMAGSNNWVIGKKKSASGFPILANDPHMSLSNPPIWYFIHLQAPGLNVIGSSFPGTPGIVIGHNEKIAWGVTTVMYDVTDIYMDVKDNNDKNKYLFKGDSLPLKTKTVKVNYKEGDKILSEEKTIKYTVHGPVIKELDTMYITFKWTGFEPTFELETFAEINTAQNLKQFKSALTHFKVGAQNFIYADVYGNIFWQATGAVPIRKCTPIFLMNGASGECEWTGFIPYKELPHLENPPQDFIVTANNRPIGKDYKYYIGAAFDTGFRAHEITKRLTEKEKISFKDMQSIQADIYSLPAELIKPIIFDAFKQEKNISPEIQNALDILKKWDNNTTVDSIACTIFHTFLKLASINTLKDDFGDEHFNNFGGMSEIIIGMLLKKNENNGWFDDKTTPEKETKSIIIRKSFIDAYNNLKTKFGADTKKWEWGNIHSLTLGHPLFSEYNLGPFKLPGAIHSVNAAGFGILGDEFNFGGGPSQRFVAEVKGKIEHSESSLPGGENANPKSKHHTDLLKLWLQCKAVPLYFTDKEINKNTEEKIIIGK